MKALDRAIKLAGGLTNLANLIGVSPQVVCNWRKRGSIPATRVLQIEQATSDKNGRPLVLRHDLRPDLYPEDEAA
jgi:DNA-binding transcriptional regulator YdaS (Cro superfamily)